jgi:hypothetical protein
MLSAGGQRDHLVSVWIEGHHGDQRPVSGGPRPASRMALSGLAVQRVPCRQNGMILPGVTLLWAPYVRIVVAPIEPRTRRRQSVRGYIAPLGTAQG